MLAILGTYARIWTRLTLQSFQNNLTSRLNAVLFLFGKLLRLFLFLLVFSSIFRGAEQVAGYRYEEILLFFLTFNLIDTLTQLFFREVYRFRQHVISGDLDFMLLKPMNPLFRVLLGGTDPLDVVMLIPIVALVSYLLRPYLVTDPAGLLRYAVMAGNGVLIATSLHILVLTMGLFFVQIDHVIMIYRDVSGLVRFPFSIYRDPIRFVLVYIVPVAVMMNFPVLALLGELSTPSLLASIGLSLAFLVGALSVWRRALSRYASASS